LAQNCYLCSRYVLSPMCPGRTVLNWSGRKDLNLRPPGPEISVQNPQVVDSVSLRGRTASSLTRILHPMLHPTGMLLSQPIAQCIKRLPSRSSRHEESTNLQVGIVE
jgi:hypothetical protein